MPGHVKKTTGPDPDPSPWLCVSEELKKKLLTKPYDAKKSCWVPDKVTHGYDEGLIQSTDGDKVTVKLLESGEVCRHILLFEILLHTLRIWLKKETDIYLHEFQHPACMIFKKT